MTEATIRGAGRQRCDRRLALRRTGLSGAMECLTRHRVAFTKRTVNDQGLFQRFLAAPNGIKDALDIPNDAVGSVRPVATDSGLKT